jgi:hypothetical protein
MLVPAMTFAWWLVSMSAAAPRAPSHGTLNYPSARTGAAETETPQQDSDKETAPAEEAAETEETEADTTFTRVSLKVVTPEIVRVAKTFLDLPMGAERSVNIDGHRYVFVLERHYHPPGFVGGPHGWHKGVTAYGTE